MEAQASHSRRSEVDAGEALATYKASLTSITKLYLQKKKQVKNNNEIENIDHWWMKNTYEEKKGGMDRKEREKENK